MANHCVTINLLCIVKLLWRSICSTTGSCGIGSSWDAKMIIRQPFKLEVVPQVALLGSLASVGFAFLFTGTFLSVAFKPLVGLISFYLLIMALHADAKGLDQS